MAVSAYAVTTLAELKSFLNIASADTTNDTTLEGWIDKVGLAIEAHTNRKIAVQSVTNEIYDGDGTDTLWLRYWPLTQLSTETSPTDAQKLAGVQYRDDPDSSWTDIEDDVDHIFHDTNWPFIKLYEAKFPVGVRNIRLNYKAGYSTVPGDIWQVALEMAAGMWNNSKLSGIDRLGKTSAGIQGFSDSFVSLRPEWREVLERYRLPGGPFLTSQVSMSR